MYTKKHEFWHDELCLDLVDSDPSTKAKLYECHGLGGNQKWEHDRVRRGKLRYATALRVSVILGKHWRTVFPNTDRQDTVEPRFNEPLYSEVLGITNDIFQPSNSVMYGKETRYNEPSIERTTFPSPLALR